MTRTSKMLAFSAGFLLCTGAVASPEHDGLNDHDEHQLEDGLDRADPSAPLIERDAVTDNVISTGPFAKVIKNLAVFGRGERNVADATTDIWVHEGYAYTGTFNTPCGGDP
ncbi:MAG: hypothetical protein R3310_04815, partial [Candidatus Competibacteraceae bacterium]|nr:hypothetical protein [Candidatus Competibacteraceae bacterium]